MRSVLGVLLTMAVLVVAPVHSQASAPGSVEVIGVAHDAAGDVRVTHARGATLKDRRSIDLRKLTITARKRVVRFRLDIDRVRRTTKFNQIFQVNLLSPRYDFTQLVVSTSPRRRNGLERWIVTEGADNDQGYVECDRLDLRFRDGAGQWWVDVPRRCLPAGEVRIAVYAQTTAPNNSPQYSHDRLVLGRCDVGGTIPPGYDAKNR